MLALYRSGRQAEALEVYRRGRTALVKELGIEPAPALQELDRAILRQDPSLELGERVGEQAAEAPPPERAILVAVPDEARLDGLLALAEPLALRPRREVILARLLAEATALGSATARLHERVSGLAARGVVARTAVFTSERPGDDLVRLLRACYGDCRPRPGTRVPDAGAAR